jgi:dTDP-3-amino-3,4,6-trideoxy-alpha-D-glucose transaminase
MIPQANPRAQYISHQVEIDRAIARVLEKGRYILGEEAAAFEREFADYLGVQFGVGVGSGTEALHLALRACGVKAGDEVITVAHTAVATVAAIELCGATPVLVDIDPRSFTLDPTKLEAAITPATRAIIPVHLYGQSADLDPILSIARKRRIRVIEDCAQSHGATYRGRRTGAWGDMACFSFYPTKNLGAVGDGGFVATNDPQLAENARLLREYGWRERYVSDIPGWNTRLDELQAAILRVKLRVLDVDNARRRRLAAMYDGWLVPGSVILPVEMPYGQHVYHLYVVRAEQRDVLQTFLKGRGIGCLVHYPVPVHLQPAYRGRLGDVGSLPETERAAREILSLPMFPELTEAEVHQVADTLREFFR